MLRLVLDVGSFTIPQLVSLTGIGHEIVARTLEAALGDGITRTDEVTASGLAAPSRIWVVDDPRARGPAQRSRPPRRPHGRVRAPSASMGDDGLFAAAAGAATQRVVRFEAPCDPTGARRSRTSRWRSAIRSRTSADAM